MPGDRINTLMGDFGNPCGTLGTFTWFYPRTINVELLRNISPVSWENVILYGDYVLNRNKVDQ